MIFFQKVSLIGCLFVLDLFVTSPNRIIFTAEGHMSYISQAVPNEKILNFVEESLIGIF